VITDLAVGKDGTCQGDKIHQSALRSSSFRSTVMA